MSLANFSKPQAPKTSAKRGKTAEGKVREYIKALDLKLTGFTGNRIGDAGAAGGRFVSQAGDFQTFGWGKNWLLEVKEVAHDYRVKHANFGEEQVARMRKREMAGTVPLVLVYHSTVRQWRMPDFEFFGSREGGSWDLRDWNLGTLASFLDAEFRP